MPQRLKSLELQGYKTFANRFRFEFGEHITAIVGPNGSGKSNIADALRWVLGEQSYTMLRAHKTEDMIFSGSAQRPRAGMATATVVFDNTDHWLPIDYSEVALTRRAARDGQNEYLLNGQRVRLRDIRELLGHAGLSEHTYTFIGQGLVDAALALRPEERRQMLEGAAGIGVYRQRREETMRRLDATRRNLERVQDILAELAPRLRRLERQARRSREAAQLQADLELMLRDWYGYHWHAAQQRLTDARQAAARQEEARQAALAHRQQIAAKVAALRQTLTTQRNDLNERHRELAELHREMENLSRDLAVLEERYRALRTREEEWLYEIQALEARIQDQQERLRQANDAIARAEERHAQAVAEHKKTRQVLETLLERRNQARAAVEQAQQTIATLTRRQAAIEARLEDLVRRRERLQTALTEAEQQTQKLQTALETAQQASAAADQTLQETAARREQAQKNLAAAREALRQAEQNVLKAQRDFDRIQAQISALEARASVLADAEAHLTGYAEGTRWLIKQARKKRLPLKGALGQHLQVPAELETAIAAALDRFAEAVLLESDLKTAPLTLSGQAPARTALLPLRALRPAPLLQRPDQGKDQEGIIGIAAQLVQAEAAFRPAVDALLGHVLIVRDRVAALRWLPQLPAHAWAITLDGEAFSPQGIVTTGKPAGGTALRRTRERREIAAQLAELRAQAEAHARARQQAETAVSEARQAVQQAEDALRAAEQAYQDALAAAQRARQQAAQARQALEMHQNHLERLRRDLQTLEEEADRLAHQRDALTGEFQTARQTLRQHQQALQALDATEANAQEAHWSTQVALAAQALEAARSQAAEQQQVLERLQQRYREQQQRLEETQKQVQAIEARRADLQQKIQQTQNAIEQLNARIRPAQKALEEARQQLETLETEAEKATQAVNVAERHHAQAQLSLVRAQETLDNLRQRIEEDLGPVSLTYEPDMTGPQPLPLEGIVSQLPRRTQIPEDLETRIKQQRAQLRRLGPINPEAEQEYNELRERYDFLTAQMDDLQQAEANIHKAIAELEDLMQTAFHKTFEIVGREFSSIFTRLFGGGTARLVLTEPEDVTRTGVEIEARLPGKRQQRLAMLSGGERSLTAVALIFALLKASPTPFCVLDEVDAMLDEANVGRFRDLLVELSEHTQFIIITHNRNTVQAAEVIYGVTLAPDTTSQVMSLKLDEVAKMVK